VRGPVSAAIEQEVLGEVRRQGIVIWLDKDATYSRLVDDLASKHGEGEFPFPVVAFRGSFLELLMKLESFGSGLDKQRLLVHMPGFNEETIRKTPVLELYEPGTRFRKSLETLVREAATGRVAPAEVDTFVGTQPTLEQADAWLSSAVSQSAFGLSAMLDEVGPKVLAEALIRPANSGLALRVAGPEEGKTLTNYVHKLVGMDDAWGDIFGRAEAKDTLDSTLFAVAAWILCVEYVHDLKRPPHLPALQRLRGLSAPLVKASVDLVAAVRRDGGDAYARMADEVEGFLAEELKAMTPEDLGQIDTFREEENRVLKGAVEALERGEWSKAKSWCEVRHGERSYWLQRDQLRRWAWSLVAEAAEFGVTLEGHPRPFEKATSLEQAVDLYAAGAFEVDRAHRRFEQTRLALLDSRLPHYGALREVATALRRAHRDWADSLARDFAGLCKAQGFLPPASLQQRTLFEQIVHPLTLQSEKVAVFLIDAFRFEMATELIEELKGIGTVVDLKPRLAELPTITSVGMNVLAPVAQGGKLAVAGVFQGFKAGEFTVRKPEDRSRAMGLRSAGKPALERKLADICEASTAALTKDVKAHPLVVVHSKEIDDAGEANVGVQTFETTLRQIKAAWHHLQLAGVKHFVFTADHGFLLQDETTAIRDYGTKRDPQRRHVLDEQPRAEAGMVNVAVSALGYEGLKGYLLFREDTAVFATGNAGATFVHGGNSPQERIIPVLTVTRKRVETASLAEYAIEIEPKEDIVGLHRVRVRVVFPKGTTTSLGFAAARTIDLAIQVLDRSDTRVLIKDVSKPGALKGGRVQVPVGDDWSEVFFALEGASDDRVRIEVNHPDRIEKVRGASLDEWYAVSGRQAVKAPSVPPPPQITPLIWADTITDEGVRKVFLHIEKHGVITETEVNGILGSPRATRRFSVEWEAHVTKLPFIVRTEPGESGKRWVKEGNR
jgi:hypothetical protein